jgi:hypothetical protein
MSKGAHNVAGSSGMKDLFDVYSRRARLLPGAITALPFTLLVVVLISTKPAWWSAAASLLGASGLTYFGTQIVRSLGSRTQAELWTSWGGAPTTQMLRFASKRNKNQIERWHRNLEKLFPDEHVPTEAEEVADPESADAAYETLIAALIARTRNREKFPRVFDENCQYGFRRNLYGCRRIGTVVSLVSLAIVIGLGIASALGLNVSALSLIAVGAADLLVLAAFRWIVNPGWVREAGDAYAARLIETSETLPGS